MREPSAAKQPEQRVKRRGWPGARRGAHPGPGADTAAPPDDAPTPSAFRRIAIAMALVCRAAPFGFAATLLLTLLTGAAPVVTAWLMKLVLDRLVGREPLSALLPLAVALAATGIATAMLPQLTEYLRAEMNRRVHLLTLDRLFTAVDGFVGLRRFEDPHFLDRLRLAQPAAGTNPNDIVAGLLGIARAALTLTGLLGALFLLGPVMAAVVLLAGVPMLIAEIALSRRRARMLWRVGPIERREFFYTELLSSVEAAKEVRLFGTGAFLRRRMLTERRAANAAKRSMDRRDVAVQAGLATLSAVVSGAGLVWAVAAAQRGALSVGDVAVFVAAVAGTQGSLAGIATEIARCHQAQQLFGHYLTVTTRAPDLPVARPPRALPRLSRGITVRDVWFRYSPEHPWVLRGVTLHIPSGSSVALVGLNGAGKSTLVKLICRFYDPTRGAILWDGVDLRQADPAELRRRVGAVFQDYMRYDMTAGENIALGDLSALGDEARLHAAARRAGIHDRITELPRGYETLLSRQFFMTDDEGEVESGAALSGGQWQRLALARAFLRDDRDLMILDEPSAGLDAAAEHEIHASLRRCRQGRTSLLISHRLGAVRDADTIVVLDGGRITEQGDHAQLLALGGEYARLFTLQAAGYRDPGAAPSSPAPGATAVAGER
ncbi:ABC transporter ATP-binding protein [Streptomyces olivaceoviridis]